MHAIVADKLTAGRPNLLTYHVNELGRQGSVRSCSDFPQELAQKREQ